LKFPAADTVALAGVMIVEDTIAVVEGWNAIGSVGVSIPVSCITSDPPGMVTGSFWEYTGTYSEATFIEPGKGYWVNSGQEGRIILSAYAVTSRARPGDSRLRIIRTSEIPPPPPSEETQEPSSPDVCDLARNFPNPFNPSTEIRFYVPFAGQVSLKVYNLLGQEVKTLVDGPEEAGKMSVLWDGTNSSGEHVSSGMYLCRLEATSGPKSAHVNAVIKLILMR
jgi:hypothetical protein